VWGSNGLQAINGAIEEFSGPGKRMELRGFGSRVSKTMKSCADLSGSTLYDAVLHFGEGSYSTSMVS